jgi:hypothetical protein
MCLVCVSTSYLVGLFCALIGLFLVPSDTCVFLQTLHARAYMFSCIHTRSPLRESSADMPASTTRKILKSQCPCHIYCRYSVYGVLFGTFGHRQSYSTNNPLLLCLLRRQMGRPGPEVGRRAISKRPVIYMCSCMCMIYLYM